MKEFIKITGILTSVCIICGFLLSFIFGMAAEKIERNAVERIERAVFQLAPRADRMEEIKLQDTAVYKLFDTENQLIGYGFLGKGMGYQGQIVILGVIDSSLEYLEGIEIVESVETPGLGARIQEDSFKEQFKRRGIAKPIECIKEVVSKDNQIQAITAATVSSKAVANILNKRIEELKQQLAQ